ncbi:MAG TPA: helix-turn-helix domain-containing protein [Candidatus Eremiobacteraeota bacterium]|nr:helix-turn-helix domain-containing protein [Candidatus Eremiobacteraeota bacterium]
MEDINSSNSKETAIFEEKSTSNTEQIAKNIKNRIVSLLAENLETIEDMSKKTGIPESTLASYMRGIRRPGIDKLIDIASVYDISIQWLVGLSEHKKSFFSYRDGTDNMNYRYNLESNCVRIETVRPTFCSFHYGEKNNIFSYENFYKNYYPDIDTYVKFQHKRGKLLSEGKLTLEEIVSLKNLEDFLCSGRIPIECQEELLYNVRKALKYNNYDLILIDKEIHFNFDIIDNKVVCIELRLADEIMDYRTRKMYVYFYSQTLIDDLREERKCLRKIALRSVTNSQIIETLLKNISRGTDDIRNIFSKIREREEKLLELMDEV